MNATIYQEQAARTLLAAPGFDIPAQQIMLLWNAIGLAGEAGEVAEHIKKGVLHQHGIDPAKLGKELGDVLWYVAGLCTTAGLDLSAVMAANIEKLQARYPNGFTSVDSQRRVDLEQEPILESESQLERDLRRTAASKHFTAQQLRDAVSKRNRRALMMLQQGVTVSYRRIEFDEVVNRLATELESALLPAPTWPDPMASLRTRLNDAVALNAKLQTELTAMTARAEQAERLLESLTPGGSEFHGSPARCAEFVRNRMAGVIEQVKLRQAANTALLERDSLLQLAYQVYRDAGGKIGSNIIFTFGEWLLWLPSQTDELIDPQEVQP